MGIFDSLFKPNVKKMEDEGNADGLIQCLKYNKDWQVRRAAAVGLSKVRDAKGLEPLIAALKDENEEVRRSATAALAMTLAFGLFDRPSPRDFQRARSLSDGQLLFKVITDLADKGTEHNKATTLLIQGLKDGNEDVRIGAAIVLGILRWEAAVPHLTEALNDSDEQVREKAAVALNKIERMKANPKEGSGFLVMQELIDMGFDGKYMDNAYEY